MKRNTNYLILLIIVSLLLPGCGLLKRFFDRRPREPVARKGLGHMGEIWGVASEKAREPLDEAVQALQGAFKK